MALVSAQEGAIPMTPSIVEHLTGSGRLDRLFIGGEWVVPEGQARARVVALRIQTKAILGWRNAQA
jgi:hypothetical protein